jgi:hypothetical protein
MIDSRVIPENRWVTIWIGLLDAASESALPALLAKRKLSGRSIDSHMLIAMSKAPWVWALVSWASDSEHERVEQLAKS